LIQFCIYIFQREKGVGEGPSLTYPSELLDAVRAMYPDGVKNYPPKAGKVTSIPLILPILFYTFFL
jgi:hypothetical protein